MPNSSALAVNAARKLPARLVLAKQQRKRFAASMSTGMVEATGRPWRDQIPHLARIMNVSQTVEVYVAQLGTEAALKVVIERSGV